MSPGVKVNLLQAFIQLGVFLEAPKKDDLYNVLWVNEGIYLFICYDQDLHLQHFPDPLIQSVL